MLQPRPPTMVGDSAVARQARHRYWRDVQRVARARLVLLLVVYVATIAWVLWG